MSWQCVLDGLYDGICANEDGGGGGVEPTPSEYHADVFRRERRTPLRQLAKSAVDRVVQIEYDGVRQYHPFANATGTKRRRTVEFVVKVGYFAGDNVDDTYAIIFSDDMKLQDYLRLPQNYPSCQGACVEGILPTSSSVSRIGDGRLELRITIEVQLY